MFFFVPSIWSKLLVVETAVMALSVSGYGAGVLIASHSEMASSLVSQCLQSIATVKFLTLEGGQEFDGKVMNVAGSVDAEMITTWMKSHL